MRWKSTSKDTLLHQATWSISSLNLYGHHAEEVITSENVKTLYVMITIIEANINPDT